MSKSSILDRREFKVLRRLSAAQLRQINAWKAHQWSSTHCPLAQAVTVPATEWDVADILGCPRYEVMDFMVWFDHGGDRKELTAAKRAALAEKKEVPA